MNTHISLERLAAYRKTFGWMSTEALKAIAEGRKATNLSAEAMGAIRLLLTERNGGRPAAVLPTDLPNLRGGPASRRPNAAASPVTTSAEQARGTPGRFRVGPAARAWGGMTMKARVVTIALLMLVVLGLLPATRDELRWRLASRRDRPQDYARYLTAWPSGRHATEAATRMEDLAWQEALNAKTLRSIQGYARKYPKGRFLDEAETIQAALRVDQRPFLAAFRQGTEGALKGFLTEFPGHLRAEAAQQALDEMTLGRDIVDLLSEKKIEAQTQGSGIRSVSVQLRRLMPYPLTVRIPVGTYFVSANPASQNMVATAESKVRLSGDGWHKVSPSVACANRPRDVPGSTDTFSVQRSPHQAELTKLMPVLDSARVSYPIQQAAVWIVTDNASYADLGVLVTSQFGFGGSRTIHETEAGRAMKICWEAGIDITRKRIWADRSAIWAGVRDEELKQWLEGKQ